MEEVTKKIKEVISDPEASKWLKQGLTSALKRDPAHAKADAETMHWLLGWRWEEFRKRGAM